MPLVWVNHRLEYVADVINLTPKIETELTNDIYAFVKGRIYGKWIDDNSRDNGFNQSNLIQQPAYIIESLLRDEVFVERDLTIDSSASTTTCVISSLKSSTDDYYNGAEFFNVTTAAQSYVTDYDGSSKTITINDADASMAANDNVYITNIDGINRIAHTTFDAIGNTTNGTRKDWVFDRAINRAESANSFITKALFESHTILFQSYNKYKLIALDAASSGDTWTKSLKQAGREFFDIGLTPLQNVITSFRLRYNYEHGKGTYAKEFYVDKNGFTSGGTIISATEQTLCSNAETNYRIKNNFEYSSDWIYDLTTAEYLLQKLVGWFTKQRLIVTWTTPLHDSSFDYIKYELGDQVKLNNTRMIPTGINNSSYFMIMSKQIMPLKGAPYIVWQLMEMG